MPWPPSAFDNRNLPLEDQRRGVYLKDTVRVYLFALLSRRGHGLVTR